MTRRRAPRTDRAPSRRNVRLAVTAAVCALAVACSDGGTTRSGVASRGAADVSGSAAPSTPAPADLRPAPQPERPDRRAAHLGPFDAADAVAFATRLASEIGPRPAGSATDERARDVVARAFEAAGWTVEQELFDLPQGGTSANVVAWRGARPGRHVVVGAHLDTVEESPGANDNATGVGVIVSVARELADESPPIPVVLVAFGAEEYQPSDPRRHHIGSDAYVDRHGEDVTGALSVDMVGNGDTTCICWFAAGPGTLARRLDDLAPDHGFEVRTEGDIGDHGPFARAGIPAAVLWTGRDGRYHSPRDTAEHLRVGDVDRAGSLVLAWLRNLAGPRAALR